MFDPVDARHQLEYLKALGIKVWLPKDASVGIDDRRPVAEVVTTPTTKPAPDVTLEQPPSDVSTLDWGALYDRVKTCTSCCLHEGRTQAVFGVGNQDADLMVIGEAPGADEDRQGEPFVGRAGQLLNEMLIAINHPRETVYIANIVKCRPPENRNPQHDEALQCAGYLQRQIELLAPRAILALGKVAAQNLLQTDQPIGKMRGNQYYYGALNIPVIVTYHPAYLLRSPKEKRKVWQDLKLLNRLINL